MRKLYMINEGWMDGRLTRPLSLGLRAWNSDGFKATPPYVTHHYTMRSAVLHNTHFSFGAVGQLQHQSGPLPAIIHPSTGVGRANLSHLSLRASHAKLLGNAHESERRPRAQFHVPPAEKTYARTPASRTFTGARTADRDRQKRAVIHGYCWGGGRREIVEIDSSNAVTCRNRSECVSAECGRVYSCGDEWWRSLRKRSKRGERNSRGTEGGNKCAPSVRSGATLWERSACASNHNLCMWIVSKLDMYK